ncbi:MAG: hypothetical protein ACRYHQ_38115 [Janthinobacterium lividum]
MRLLPALAFGSYAAQAQPVAVQQAGTPDAMGGRMLACAPCHGTKGQEAVAQGSLGQGSANDIFPHLASKPAR